jgi:hypothetical protein
MYLFDANERRKIKAEQGGDQKNLAMQNAAPPTSPIVAF